MASSSPHLSMRSSLSDSLPRGDVQCRATGRRVQHVLRHAQHHDVLHARLRVNPHGHPVHRLHGLHMSRSSRATASSTSTRGTTSRCCTRRTCTTSALASSEQMARGASAVKACPIPSSFEMWILSGSFRLARILPGGASAAPSVDPSSSFF